jgi:hypothetical protein
MVAFFKLISKQSGSVTTFFELDVKGDSDLDFLNSLKQNCYLKQIEMVEYEWLLKEQREKCYFFDGRP